MNFDAGDNDSYYIDEVMIRPAYAILADHYWDSQWLNKVKYSIL